MIIVYSADAASAMEIVKDLRKHAQPARYLDIRQFAGPNDAEPDAAEVWLLDGPHEGVEAVYGDIVVAKYPERSPDQHSPETATETPQTADDGATGGQEESPEDGEVLALRERAEALGVNVDLRWKAATLRKKIEEAYAE